MLAKQLLGTVLAMEVDQCGVRSQIAVGRQYGASQPPAGDMMELTWDPELARVAQARADSCVFQHECSDCRRVRRFKADLNTSDHGGPLT